MSRARASGLLFRAFAILGIALFLTRIAIAWSTTSLYHRWYSGQAWTLLLIPSSPWLVLWLVTLVAGLSRWGAIRFVLAGASPLLIWGALSALGTVGSSSLVRGQAFWLAVDAILQIVLALAGLASVTLWWLDLRARKASQARSPAPPK